MPSVGTFYFGRDNKLLFVVEKKEFDDLKAKVKAQEDKLKGKDDELKVKTELIEKIKLKSGVMTKEIETLKHEYMKIKRQSDAHAGQLAEKDLEISNYKKLDAERLASENHSNQVLKAYDKKFSDFVGQLDGVMKMMDAINQQKLAPSPLNRIPQSPKKSPPKPDARAEHLKTIQPVNSKQKTQNYVEGRLAEKQGFSKLFDNVQLEETQALV